jgi:hypothetical protein
LDGSAGLCVVQSFEWLCVPFVLITFPLSEERVGWRGESYLRPPFTRNDEELRGLSLGMSSIGSAGAEESNGVEIDYVAPILM